MSSNIKVNRICQHCRREFIARTTVTKYCSDKCSKAAYKARKRAEKIKTSNDETRIIKQQPIEQLKAKEFLNVNEVGLLLGISRRTIYRLIEQGELNKIKIRNRTIIQRSALNKLLNRADNSKTMPNKNQDKKLIEWDSAESFNISECYTLNEIQEKYRISEKTVHQLITRNNIPKLKKGWYAYVPKRMVDELLT